MINKPRPHSDGEKVAVQAHSAEMAAMQMEMKMTEEKETEQQWKPRYLRHGLQTCC